jgi:hypothetical protein
MATPKYLSRDCELSTTGVAADGRTVDAWRVTRKILACLPQALGRFGAKCWTRGDMNGSAYSSDCLRYWTSGGQCYYSDMGHLEVCGAESLRPQDFALQGMSLLRVAEAARREAAQREDAEFESEHPDAPTAWNCDGQAADRFCLSASNADNLDPAISWGSHLNVSIDSTLWTDLFLDHSRPARLSAVSSMIAAGIAFFGAGYLLPMKDGSTAFSLSARAHHLAHVHTLATTEPFRRGILNSRREPHAATVDRLHLIGFDYPLLGAPLLASYLQCALAAVEDGYCGMQLFEPVRALRIWSWTFDLRNGKFSERAQLVDGRKLTLPEYVADFARQLLKMVESGLINEQIAPQAGDNLARIIELASFAQEGSIQLCARQIDWAAKLLMLLGSGEPLGNAASRQADHDFTNTDPRRGALWRLIDEGLVDAPAELDRIDASIAAPPVDSRAWGRGKLIEQFASQITDVDWSRIEFRLSTDRWGRRGTIEMPKLDGFTKYELDGLLTRAGDLPRLHELLQRTDGRNVRQIDPLDDVCSQLFKQERN